VLNGTQLDTVRDDGYRQCGGCGMYLRWRGDMLMKKTDVRAGSTFSFTHRAHVVSTLRYASMRTTSSCSSQLCPPGLLPAIDDRTSAEGHRAYSIDSI